MGFLRALYRYTGVFVISVWHLFRLLWIAKQHGDGSLPARTYARTWATDLCKLLGMDIHYEGEQLCEEPCLIVSNHTGFMDPVVWLVDHDLSYVAKKSVSLWPIFGQGASAMGCVFVDRSSPQSRAQTAIDLGKKIHDDRLNLMIFPEGTSSIEGKPWRHGSLKVAQELDLPVQAARIFFNPVRPCAYIDKDHFLFQLWHLCKQDKVQVKIELFPPVKITDPTTQATQLQAMVAASQRKQLQAVNYPVSPIPDQKTP